MNEIEARHIPLHQKSGQAVHGPDPGDSIPGAYSDASGISQPTFIRQSFEATGADLDVEEDDNIGGFQSRSEAAADMVHAGLLDLLVAEDTPSVVGVLTRAVGLGALVGIDGATLLVPACHLFGVRPSDLAGADVQTLVSVSSFIALGVIATTIPAHAVVAFYKGHADGWRETLAAACGLILLLALASALAGIRMTQNETLGVFEGSAPVRPVNFAALAVGLASGLLLPLAIARVASSTLEGARRLHLRWRLHRTLGRLRGERAALLRQRRRLRGQQSSRLRDFFDGLLGGL